MTAEVEKRIVEMRFENEQFEKAAGQTLTTLGKLEGILDVMGEAGAEQLTRTLDQIEYRFSTFGIAAASVIENVTGKVVNLTASLLSAIPEKIISGGINRAFNLEDAEFRLKGLGVQWASIEDDLEYAVNQTAYGLDEAAQAASILAGANIDWTNNIEGASDMGHALRAISGVAAMTGSSYSDIAAVLTDVAAAGRVTGDVITRLAYRGMNVTAALSKSMGKSQQEIQQMLQDGKISVQEFYRAMDKAFGEHATDANETYSGSLMNIGAALSRIGADFIMPLHKWLIPINNSLRTMFNRMRDVTKPFAEGRWAAHLGSISGKLVKIFDGVSFDWLKPVLSLFGKFLSLVDKGIDRITEFGKKVKAFFTDYVPKATSDNAFLAFEEWDKFDALGRMSKILKIVTAVRESFRMAGDTMKKFGEVLNKAFGGSLGKIFDFLLDKLVKLSDLFLNNTESIWINIKKFMEKAGKVAESLHDTFHKAFVAIWTVLSKTYTFLRDAGVFRFFGNMVSWAFGKLGDILLWVSDHLGDFFDKLTEIINHGGKAGGVLGLIGEGFRGIGDIFGTIFGHLNDFVKLLFNLEEGETVFSKFADILRNAGKNIRKMFSDMRDAIDETLSKDGVGTEAIKIATALLSVLLGYRKVEKTSWAISRFEKVLNSLRTFTGDLYNLMKRLNPAQLAADIEDTLMRVHKALRAFTDNLNAKSLLYIAGAVIGLAFGLMMLASVVETGHLVGAITGLVVVMGTLIGALFLMKKIIGGNKLASIGKGWAGFLDILKNSLSRFMDAFTMKEMAIAMLAIAGALAIMAIAIGIFAYVIHTYKTDAWMGLVMIAEAMLILVGALWALNAIFKETGMFDSAKFVAIGIGMVLMAAAVGILTLALWGLSKIPWQQLISGGIALIVLMAALVGAMVVLSKWAANPLVMFAAVSMIAVAAAMVVLAVAVAIFSAAIAMFGWDGLIAMTIGLVLLAAGLALLSTIAPAVALAAVGLLVGAAAVLIFAAAILVLAIAVAVIDGLSLDGLGEKLAMFALVIIGLVAVLVTLSAIGPMVLVAAGALLLVGLAILAASAGFAAMNASLVNLAIALNMLDGLDLVTIGKGLKEVGKGLIKIAGAAFKFNFGNYEAFNYLPSLASAMLLLDDVDIQKLADKKTGLPALAKALNSFGGLFGTGMHLVFGDGGLLAAGPAFTSLGNGLQNLTPALVAFSNLQDPDGVTNQIRDLITAINSFGYWDNKTKGNMQAATQALSSIAASLGEITMTRVSAVAALADTLSNFDADKAAGVQEVAVIMGELVTTIEAYGNTFVAHGESISLLIWRGIRQGYDEANGLRWGFSDMLDALSNTMKNFNDSGVWNTHGRNIAVGIANGITNNSYVAQNALTRLANSLSRSFQVTLSIHSPSRVFENLAGYIPAGIARGIQNGQQEVTNSLVSAMSGALGYLEKIGSETENFAPQIRPVMDLGQMRREYGQADALFRNSGFSTFGGINGVNVNGDSINYNMQNRDVVAELQVLETRIGQLGKAIENMKLVMDTGMIVGALAPQMNSQLGTYAVRERRQ